MEISGHLRRQRAAGFAVLPLIFSPAFAQQPTALPGIVVQGATLEAPPQRTSAAAPAQGAPQAPANLAVAYPDRLNRCFREDRNPLDASWPFVIALITALLAFVIAVVIIGQRRND